MTENALSGTKLLWNAREAAKALSVSERTLYSRTQDGTLPCVRLGGRRLYDPAALRAWIARQQEGGAA
mgnify:FL=1